MFDFCFVFIDNPSVDLLAYGDVLFIYDCYVFCWYDGAVVLILFCEFIEKLPLDSRLCNYLSRLGVGDWIWDLIGDLREK